MTKKPNLLKDKFKLIEKDIRSGDFQGAHEKLKSIVSIKSLMPLDRITVALSFYRIGQSSKALKTLMKELSPNACSLASLDDLCEQAALAFILNQFGAKNSVQRILNKVNEEVELRKANLSSLLPQIDKFIGAIYLGNYNYPSAYEAYKKVTDQYPEKRYINRLATISMADSLEGMGKSDEAIDTVKDILNRTKDNELVLKSICNQAIGEYYIKLKGDEALEQAYDHFNKALEYLDPKSSFKDHAFLKKWLGILHYLKCDYDKALSHLLESLYMLLRDQYRPTTIFEVYYWLEQLPNFTVKLEDKLALRAHPLDSPYSILAGKLSTNKKTKLHPWIQELLRSKKRNYKKDSWLITDKIEEIAYSSIYKSKNHKKNFLDLTAGIYLNDDGVFKILTHNQASTLMAIIGSGSLGINQWALIDSVYNENFYNPNSGIERINKVVDQLRKLGFAISRKQNQYFFQQPDFLTIVIPRNISYSGIYRHFQIFYPRFIRSDLEKMYSIKKSTANLWIKKWEETDLIEKFGVGKSSYYQFK